MVLVEYLNMIKDEILILEPWPNGGWTITIKGSPHTLCDQVGAYSNVNDMLVALTDMLTTKPTEQIKDYDY
jgi:hypothetical protein